MRNILWICLVLLVLSNIGCVKDKMTAYKATLHNNSGADVLILPYKNGLVLSSDTIRLTNGGSIEIANGSDWGDVKVAGFSSDYFGGPNDSTIILFNDSFRVAHYANVPATLSSKHYLFESNRNLLNPLNYEFIREKNTKGNFINVHDYYFTADDYNFARQ
ncbi:MAG: hypothetical protein JNM21_13170 [Taibaiella sp.]|nr:hypothetical protein [Taibaiella sp.]